MFYIYKWYIVDTNEVIYVGKGSKKRYLSKQHNKLFKEFIKRFNCKSKIIEYFDSEKEAYIKEFELIEGLKQKGQCVCNIYKGGNGGGASINTSMTRWTKEAKEKYSVENVMKSMAQRERMKNKNPMKIKEYAMKNGLKHRKPFFIGNKEFQTLAEAANFYKCTIQSIEYCLKKGYKGNDKCYYKYGNQQPSHKNSEINSIVEGSTTNE